MFLTGERPSKEFLLGAQVQEGGVVGGCDVGDVGMLLRFSIVGLTSVSLILTGLLVELEVVCGR